MHEYVGMGNEDFAGERKFAQRRRPYRWSRLARIFQKFLGKLRKSPPKTMKSGFAFRHSRVKFLTSTSRVITMKPRRELCGNKNIKPFQIVLCVEFSGENLIKGICHKVRETNLPSNVIRLIRSWRSCDRMHSSSCGRLKSKAS